MTGVRPKGPRPGTRWVVIHAAAILCTALVAGSLEGHWSADVNAALAHGLLLGGTAALQARWAPAVGALRWFVATVLGIGVGGILGVGTMVTLDGMGHEFAGSVLGAGLIGGGVGVAQAFLLRTGSRIRIAWIGCTIAGWGVGSVTWDALVRTGHALPPFAWVTDAGHNEIALLAYALFFASVVASPLVGRASGDSQ